MKMKAISGIVYFVKDMKRTAKFYKALGFQVVKETPDHLSVRLNWFRMDFHPQEKEDKPEFRAESSLDQKGAGQYVYASVDDVDKFYKELISKGFKPTSEPRDSPWDYREVVLRDPDGFKLVFFSKAKKSKSYKESVSL